VKNRVILEELIEEIFVKKTTQEWLHIFEGSGMPYAAINDVQTTLNHEHGSFPLNLIVEILMNIVRARDMVTSVEHPACGKIELVNTPVKFSFSKPGIRTPPPTLGEHTEEILKELGLSEKDMTSLRSEGVVA
jgi:succinate---hydroxymethylglutarate CoA-transferase